MGPLPFRHMSLNVPDFCVQHSCGMIWTWNIVGTFFICPHKSETTIWIWISFIFCCHLILVCSLINSPLCSNLSINDFWKPRVSHDGGDAAASTRRVSSADSSVFLFLRNWELHSVKKQFKCKTNKGLQPRSAYPPLRRTLKVSLNGVVGSCIGPRAGESQCSPCACDTPAYK